MLVLTRRIEESITIGDPLSSTDAIEVIVLEVRGDQARLGIKAPPATAVHHAEVYKQIQQESQSISGFAAHVSHKELVVV